MTDRKILRIQKNIPQHWVGDGFPVRSLMFYGKDENISPFLLLDHAGPSNFLPADKPRGVEQHPHRGFETVTIVYDGEVEHCDNAGNAGKISSGDVQWMTAGRGILHEEMHSKSFTERGGKLEMVQLWVNLPAKDKMTAPHYQEIRKDTIPTITQDGNIIRVIAGGFREHKGAAKTFTPVHLFDLRLKPAAPLTFPIEQEFNAFLLVLSGKVTIDNKPIHAGELVQFSADGDTIALEANEESKVLFLAGAPINEPIAGHGPFVMNTEEEIRQAFKDYRAGKF